MSKPSAPLHHPINGMQEPTWEGFSWPAFLFGAIWLLVKGLYGQFFINVLLLLMTFGFAAPLIWLFYGIKGNALYKKALLKKGYLSSDQWNNQVKQSQPATQIRNSDQTSTTLLQLQQLGDLRTRGVLTEEEFLTQKNQLLAPQASASVHECLAALAALGYLVKQVRETAWDISDPSNASVSYARSLEQLQQFTRQAWSNQSR